ncbi:hypothetical protein Nepgr_024735 [Nepenthes gracilis]|uniref:Uncharacterized protein n=1 Tax=Nepenthes gracilis TaxID=150966 RepID=A0AAD3T6H6_NEPGR|nr:hypothetical protein Nepgr_024735 [Nepenthes gracilis]
MIWSLCPCGSFRSTSNDMLPPLDLKACSPNELMRSRPSLHICPSSGLWFPIDRTSPIDYGVLSRPMSIQGGSLLIQCLPSWMLLGLVNRDPLPSKMGLAVPSIFPADNGVQSCLLDASRLHRDLVLELLLRWGSRWQSAGYLQYSFTERLDPSDMMAVKSWCLGENLVGCKLIRTLLCEEQLCAILMLASLRCNDRHRLN